MYWTEEDEIKLLDLRAEGKTFREIAEIFGISVSAVIQKYRRLINRPSSPRVKILVNEIRTKRKAAKWYIDLIVLAKRGIKDPGMVFSDVYYYVCGKRPRCPECSEDRNFEMKVLNDIYLLKCKNCGCEFSWVEDGIRQN